MKIPAALESQAVLIGLGVVAVLIFAANSRSITAGSLTCRSYCGTGTACGLRLSACLTATNCLLSILIRPI